MPLVTTRKMLMDAQRGGYAIGAFNAENSEMVWAIAEAAKELASPVIIQTTSSTLKYFAPAVFAGMARAAAEKAGIPAALHLDHGSGAQLARECIDAGYSSVMIDGSQLSFEENIRLAAQVTDYAANYGVPVEAELGTIGGKEDDTVAQASAYTDPEEAVRFAAETGIDSLAIAIGTAHGIYKTAPVLNLARITEIGALLRLPLVMHGASGLSDEVVRDAVSRGISKVNFATELRVAYTEAVREYLTAHPAAIDPKAYGGFARERVKALVKEKILICGSAGVVTSA